MCIDPTTEASVRSLFAGSNGPGQKLPPVAALTPPHLVQLRAALEAAWMPVLDAAALGQDLPKGTACLERLARALRPYTAEPWCPESLESGDEA